MKRLALIISIMGFFGLAIVGWVSGLPPHTCAIKALVGAAALFVLLRFAGRLVVRIMVDAIVDNLPKEQGGPNEESNG